MRKYQLAGALFALISVVLGAFASHLLKAYLGTEQLHSFETGTRYMMYHGLSLLLLSSFDISQNVWIFRLFFWGTILFSLSIYLLSLQEIIAINFSWLGPITPIGGTLIIMGWCLLIWCILNKRKKN